MVLVISRTSSLADLLSPGSEQLRTRSAAPALAELLAEKRRCHLQHPRIWWHLGAQEVAASQRSPGCCRTPMESHRAQRGPQTPAAFAQAKRSTSKWLEN